MREKVKEFLNTVAWLILASLIGKLPDDAFTKICLPLASLTKSSAIILGADSFKGIFQHIKIN